LSWNFPMLKNRDFNLVKNAVIKMLNYFCKITK
jgi:hypothetical protein